MSAVGARDGEQVRAHRALLAAALGLPSDGVAWMHQVHGSRVVRAAAPTDPPPACDALVATTAGLGLGVLAADCVPVLLAAPGGAAVAHAGRAGVVAGVAGAAARALVAATGAEPTAVRAVIGPAIGPCCYEVPAALAAEVDAAVPGVRAATTWGTPSLDLVAGVVAQLRAAGVGDVGRAGGCTRCDGAGRWFSHRATGDAEARPAGRQAGVVVVA
jgi:polyphenol oxidase